MIYRRLEKRVIREVDDAPSRTQDGWYRYVVSYPEGLDAQLVSFTITTGDDSATLRNVSYCADMPKRRDIRIEIVTTTYLKERQVTKIST